MKNNDLMTSYCFETDKIGPSVLLIAGVHGDEYEPMLAAAELVSQLPGMLECGRVTIVPVTNETAYFNSNRCGEDGLDLARICPGKPEGTITESVASQISALIRKADYFIDMHTGGLTYDIYPLAGYMLHPAPEILRKQQEMAHACRFPLVWGTDFQPDGRTLSIARDANVPAIYLEYGGGTGIRNNVVTDYIKGITNILQYLNMIKNPIENPPIAGMFWIEDHRPDSGYLQGKMPSPAEGIFVSEVNMGDQIKRGQLFGKVIDPPSGQSADVYADKDGLVFLLRRMVKVKPGDALGGIMPIESLNKKVVYE